MKKKAHDSPLKGFSVDDTLPILRIKNARHWTTYTNISVQSFSVLMLIYGIDSFVTFTLRRKYISTIKKQSVSLSLSLFLTRTRIHKTYNRNVPFAFMYVNSQFTYLWWLFWNWFSCKIFLPEKSSCLFEHWHCQTQMFYLWYAWQFTELNVIDSGWDSRMTPSSVEYAKRTLWIIRSC